MIRATTAAAMLLTATVAAAQTMKDLREAAEAEKPPTRIPEIPAGADPMDRQPDPAAGTPAAKTVTEPAAGDRGTDCRVRRADTDTGFVVVCEQGG